VDGLPEKQQQRVISRGQSGRPWRIEGGKSNAGVLAYRGKPTDRVKERKDRLKRRGNKKARVSFSQTNYHDEYPR